MACSGQPSASNVTTRVSTSTDTSRQEGQVVGAFFMFQDVKVERDTYYTGVQADATHIAAEQGLELATRMEAGHAAQTIVRVAKEGGYDLVVMGYRGHSGGWSTVVRTTAETVTCHVTCGVLVVRRAGAWWTRRGKLGCGKAA